MSPWVRTSVIATACLAVVPCASRAQAPPADWAATGFAAYQDDSSWSVNGQVGVLGSTPDTAAETARFSSQPLGFTVELSHGAAIMVGAIEVSNNAFARLAFPLLGSGNGDASLSAEGGLLVDDAQLLVTNDGGGSSDLVHISAGALQLRNNGRLINRGNTTLTTQATTIAVGSTQATLLQVESPETHWLGGVSIGESGAGPAAAGAAELRVTNGALVRTGNLSLGAVSAYDRGVANVQFATLEQAGSATLTIGGDAATGAETGVLLVDAGGVALIGTGGTTIQRSGLLRNSGGEVIFNGDLLIDGGVYDEANGARREFAADINIRIEAGGAFHLADETLVLDEAQSLSVAAGGGVTGGAVTGEGGFTLGADASLEIELASLGGSAPLAFLGDVNLAGGVSLLLEEGLTPALGDFAPLASAGGFPLLPDSISAPPLSAGLEWELQTTPNELRLVVVGSATLGDVNEDGLVNAADYTVLRDTAGLSTIAADVEAWQQGFSGSAPPAILAAAAPEPAAAMLASIPILLIAAAGRSIRSLSVRVTRR